VIAASSQRLGGGGDSYPVPEHLLSVQGSGGRVLGSSLGSHRGFLTTHAGTRQPSESQGFGSTMDCTHGTGSAGSAVGEGSATVWVGNTVKGPKRATQDGHRMAVSYDFY